MLNVQPHPTSWNFPLNQSTETTRLIKSSDQRWLSVLENYVLNRLPDQVPNVDELANIVYLSPRQFTRKMKSLTGTTPARFIKSIQLDIARKLLYSNEDLTVSEVSYQCGYKYPSTFSSVFKEFYGISPSEIIAEKNELYYD